MTRILGETTAVKDGSATALNICHPAILSNKKKKREKGKGERRREEQAKKRIRRRKRIMSTSKICQKSEIV